MGDIKGRPKAPSPQVVYVPKYVAAGPSAATPVAATPTPTAEQTATAQREKSLLTRARSGLGTILTSFRGV